MGTGHFLLSLSSAMAYNRGKPSSEKDKDAMTPADIRFLVGIAGFLLTGAGYGCLVGKAAMRRSWSGKKLRAVSLAPFMILTMLGGVGKIMALVIPNSRAALALPSPAFP